MVAVVVKKRTPIGAFIHRTWGNLSIRCGKYRHLRNKQKSKCYENIIIEFTREEYRDWCLKNKEHILSLKRPSLDRIDSTKNYTLDNIQIIELIENIRKKRSGTQYLNGPKSNTKRGIRKSGNKFHARITYKTIEKHIGSFNTEDEAYKAFYEEYVRLYDKPPW